MNKIIYPAKKKEKIKENKQKEVHAGIIKLTQTEDVQGLLCVEYYAQRQATKDAGTIAGLNVLSIIAYGLNQANQDKQNVLIFDLGDGTFDVTILTFNNGVFKIKAAGNSHLGSEDFDNRLINYLVDQFKAKYNIDLKGNMRAIRRLRTASENAKRILSASIEANIEIESLAEGIDFNIKITRGQFEKLYEVFFVDCIKLVERAVVDSQLVKERIHEIVLVSGSSRISKIQNLLFI